MKELVLISGERGAGKTTLVAAFASLAQREVICDLDVGSGGLCSLLSPVANERHRFDWGHGDDTNAVRCGLCRSLFSEEEIQFPLTASGEWFVSETRYGPLVHARMDPGSENSGRLVTLLRQEGRKYAEGKGFDLLLTDGAHGWRCPVMASIRGATVVLILAEPTPSGKYEMERIADLVALFEVPAMVCVNKFDLDPEQARAIELSAHRRKVGVIDHIPFDPVFAEAMGSGKILAGSQRVSKGMAAVERVWRRILLELELLHGNTLRDWLNGEICHRLDSVGIHLNY